jgi:transcriptional regulator with XRE-family HTH domain
VPDLIDVAALRDAEGLSREDFASICGLSVDCVRSWEHGTVPSRATHAYLATIAHAPQIVRSGLGAVKEQLNYPAPEGVDPNDQAA